MTTSDAAGDVIERLGRALREPNANAQMVGSLLAIVMRERSWLLRRVPGGELVKCESLLDLLISPRPRGLGSTLTHIEALLAADAERLRAFRGATTPQPKPRRRRVLAKRPARPARRRP